MKLVLNLLLLLCGTASIAQDIKLYAVRYDLETGCQTMIFGTDVKLRAEPNTQSEVLVTLDIGTPITVIAKTKDTMIYEGSTAYWYKVKNRTKTGYILRSFIAIYGETKGSQTFLFNNKSENERNYVQVRIVGKDKPLIDYKYLLDTDEFSIEIYDNRGLTELSNVLYISYIAEACGVNGGGIYLFYDGVKLIKALETTEVVDGDSFWLMEELIFPNDETDNKSLDNKVRFSWEQGEKVDEESEWTKIEGSTREHSWQDGSWVPPIRE
jgi:uncharacterized protein YgiM (DUF1202 family)